MTPRDTLSPTDHRAGAPPDTVDVAIVGGGIAGLYCCLQLFDKYSSSGVGKPIRTVAGFEGSSRLGGRIESWRIDPKRYDGIRLDHQQVRQRSAPADVSVLRSREPRGKRVRRPGAGGRIAGLGLKPFVGACHARRSGTDPTLVINYLKAFSMLPTVEKARCRLHVCGEAYSDYQGFVEGALRSAAEVLTGPPFGIKKESLRFRERRLGRTRRVS